MNNTKKHFSLATSVDPGKKFEDLFLFGYQSTIFNDDEKALYIDQGKHLIPWMGDDLLLIDRYDGRGHLSDLTTFDADLAKGRWQPLNDREKQIEVMLDEERYYELNNDIHEKMLYEEEELKRLSEALADNSYSAVAFNYYEDQHTDQENTILEKSENAEEEEREEDTFVMPSNLNISLDISIPTSMRQYSIIERTAMFVSKEGSQMEIVIKTKQKDNPSFQFLDFTNPLYLFYKHLVELIKSGKFKPATKVIKEGNQAEMIQDSHKEDQISSNDFLQSIQDKLPVGQIANTPYAKLLSNLVKLAPIVTMSTVNATVNNVTETSATYSSEEETKSTDIGIPPPPPPPPPSEEQQESMDEEDLIYKNSPKNDMIQPSEIVPPPPDQQPIIDKMAEYVIRNGPEFEELVKMKKDKRFAFVEEDHQFRKYYVYKKQIYSQKKQNAEYKNSELVEINKELDVKNDDSSINEIKPKKLVDYEYNESSQLLVTYNSDSDESYYENDDGTTNSNVLINYKNKDSFDSKSCGKGLVSYGSPSENSDNDKINYPKSLVQYDDYDDIYDSKSNQIYSKNMKNSEQLKLLVANYERYSDNEDSGENIKKKKRRKKSRIKVYGPLLPGEIEQKKSKRVKILEKNNAEQLDQILDSQSINSPKDNPQINKVILKNSVINHENLESKMNLDTNNINENLQLLIGEELLESSIDISAEKNILDGDENAFIISNTNLIDFYETDFQMSKNPSLTNKYNENDHLNLINKNFYGPEIPDHLTTGTNIFDQNEMVTNDELSKKIFKQKKIFEPELLESYENEEHKVEYSLGDQNFYSVTNPLNLENQEFLNYKIDEINDGDLIEQKHQKENRKTKRRKLFGQHYRKQDGASCGNNTSSNINHLNDTSTNINTATFSTTENNNQPHCDSVGKLSLELNPIDLHTHLASKISDTDCNLPTNDMENQSGNQSPTKILNLLALNSLNQTFNNEKDNNDSFDHYMNYSENNVTTISDNRFQSTSYYDENALSDDESDNQSSNTNDSDSNSRNGDGNVVNINKLSEMNQIDTKNDVGFRQKYKEGSSSSGEKSVENCFRKKTMKHRGSEERHKKLKSISFMIKAKPREDDVPKVRENVFKNSLSSDDDIEEGLINVEDKEYLMEASAKNQWTSFHKDNRENFKNYGNLINQQWSINKNEVIYKDKVKDIWSGEDWIPHNTTNIFDCKDKQPDSGGVQNFKFEDQKKGDASQEIAVYSLNDTNTFDPFKTELIAIAKERVEIQKDMAAKFISKLQQMDNKKQDNDSPLTNIFQNRFETITSSDAPDDSSIVSHLPQFSSSHHLSPTTTSFPQPSTLEIKSTLRSISPMTLLSEVRISPLVENSKEGSRRDSESPKHHKKKNGKKSSHKKKKKHKKESSSKHSRKHRYESPKPLLKRYMREEDIEERMRVLNEAIEKKILKEEHEKRKRKRKRKKKKVPTATLR